MGIPEKIKAIQDEIGRTQLNKATEHHIGLLKAKIAKLKREQEAVQIKKSSKNWFKINSRCISIYNSNSGSWSFRLSWCKNTDA